MFLIQALNGYHIEDKEDEEVDILDIASDRGHFQSDHELEIETHYLKLTGNGPASGLCAGCTSELVSSCNSSH